MVLEKEELDLKRRCVSQLEAMEKKTDDTVQGLMSTLNKMANSLKTLVNRACAQLQMPQMMPTQQQFYGNNVQPAPAPAPQQFTYGQNNSYEISDMRNM